jgi:hypothetical protein
MASAHMFMDLDPSAVGYFVAQVGLAATSFGVTTDDATIVANSLNKLFNYRCSPATTVIPEQGPTLNSICQDNQCPLDPMAQCSAYPNNGTVMQPVMVNGTSLTPSNSSAIPSSPTSTVNPSMFTGGASSSQIGVGAVVGFAALAVVF